MQAISIGQFGGPEQLTVAQLPDPSAAAGELVIEVAAVGVNRVDVLVRTGRYHRAGKPPLVLGVEGAGTVLAVVAGVQGFRVGDRVLAMGETNKPGFYADRAVVPATAAVRVPDSVDLPSAASLPTAWLSAWYCLRRLADVRRGEFVLLNAAASGVGSAAVQIAVDAGATVIATAGSPEKVHWVEGLGAHQVLDSSATDSGALLDEVGRLTEGRGVNVAFDLVGGQAVADSLKAVGYGGVLAMANPRPDLTELLDALAVGRFTVPVDATFPLAQAGDAHRYLEQRANRGKVLLSVGGRP